MIFSIDIELERVYKFTYNRTVRVALTTEFKDGGNVLCYDFVRDGYRLFSMGKMENLKHVTQQTRRTPNIYKQFDGYRTVVQEGILYAVNPDVLLKPNGCDATRIGSSHAILGTMGKSEQQ